MAKAKWIAIEKEIPKDGQRVLVCGIRNGIQVCKFKEAKGFYGRYAFWTRHQEPVTVKYWMPLPEPPKEGGGE